MIQMMLFINTQGVGGGFICPCEPHLSLVAGVMEWLSMAVRDPLLMRKNDEGMERFTEFGAVSFAKPNLAVFEGDHDLRVKVI
jgi:hypothetical protein